jgi:PAS domain-containing protein
MSHQAYTLLGSIVVASSASSCLPPAILCRGPRREPGRESGTETALLSAALEEAIGRLKAQQRAMTARAEASERLSGQIVASLTAGLVVTDLDGRVQILNPSSRRLLWLSDDAAHGPVGELPASSRWGAINACARTAHRPAIDRPRRSTAEVTHLGVTVSPLVVDGAHRERHLSLHRPGEGDGPRGAAAAEGHAQRLG